MGRQKTYRDVLGWQMGCSDYHECPLCYGCRAYNPSRVKCERCYYDNKKFNICNTKLHTEEALSKMILREVIDVDAIKKKHGW